MTIFSTIIVQKQRKPTDEPQRKNAEVRSTDLPALGLLIGRVDFRFSYLILKSLKISFIASLVVAISIASMKAIVSFSKMLSSRFFFFSSLRFRLCVYLKAE